MTAAHRSPVTVGFLAMPGAEIGGMLRRALPEDWALIASDGDADGADFSTRLPDMDYLVVSASRLERRHVEKAARLRLVQRVGVGYDDIDLPALRERGIPLALCPTGSAEAVAEHAIALAMAALKRITNLNSAVRAQRWPRWEARPLVKQLMGRRVGIAGFGQIGQAAAERFLAFGCSVEVVTRKRPAVPAALQSAVQDGRLSFGNDLAGMFERCSVVSLHLPLTEATRHVVTEALLERLGPQGTLVNTARGAVVDQAALTRVLRDGRLGFAALDVLEQEPPPADLELLALSNVIVTPHIGGGGNDVFEMKADFIAANLKSFHETGRAEAEVSI